MCCIEKRKRRRNHSGYPPALADLVHNNKKKNPKVRSSINMYIYVRYINRGVASSTSHHKTSENGRTFQSRPFSSSSFLSLPIYIRTCLYIYHRQAVLYYIPTPTSLFEILLFPSVSSERSCWDDGPFGWVRRMCTHRQLVTLN